MEPDFTGYATMAGVTCSDGRVIQPNAFAHQDGSTVPLVYGHQRNSIDSILGHAVLENVSDGMLAHAYFNTTPSGDTGKNLVKHGDLTSLSIYATRLRERGQYVEHGNIIEVSLVMSGANPGASIQNISHDGEVNYEEAIIHSGVEFESGAVLSHGDSKDTENEESDDLTVEEVLSTLNEDQAAAVAVVLEAAVEASMAHDDDDDDANDDNDTNNVQHSDTEGNNHMSYNAFEQNKKDKERPGQTLTHSDVASIFSRAKQIGSLRDASEARIAELQHSIEDIDVLFPDAQNIYATPDFISRRTEWVDKVLTGTHHTPFSRIKTVHADITEDDARARGYIKGNQKVEEVFRVLKRVTTPQTIYKFQKLDRDDEIDITDFDVVVWMKGEMRVMLDEEIARAILIGDGRSTLSPEKINEVNVRSILNDDDLYTGTFYVNLGATPDYDKVVDEVVMARRFYKGSGSPVFFTSQLNLSRMLLTKDTQKRRIYSSLSDLAVGLQVREIIPVDLFDTIPNLLGIVVNLQDYNIGADKGGAVSLFEDFDLNFNKKEYLIETRCSGALTKPFSAQVFYSTASSDVLVVPTVPTVTANVLTVPTQTGVVYKKDGVGSALTPGSTVTLTTGNSPYVVVATPASGYYFDNNIEDEWTFNYSA